MCDLRPEEESALRRRDFISLLGGAATAWPIAARAQQPAVPMIGIIGVTNLRAVAPFMAALRRGLNEVGFIEGQNVAIEFRGAEGHYDRLPGLAADFVRRGVSVLIATGGTPPALAAKATTTSIPIVFVIGGDPVAAGLVASLRRPGGNMTGVTMITVDVAAKRLELLCQTVPSAASIALLVNPSNPYTETEIKEVRDAARSLRVQVHAVSASSEGDIHSAFASIVELRAAAVWVSADIFLYSRRDQLVALAARHRLPTIYAYREFAAAGGMMSYGASITDMWRLLGTYAGRILKGEKPADLPVMQPTKFELVVNLITAKALGLEVPLPLLGRADEVIE
jgi:putative tryptophan/tyrosine transport system substrate-binding protein